MEKPTVLAKGKHTVKRSNFPSDVEFIKVKGIKETDTAECSMVSPTNQAIFLATANESPEGIMILGSRRFHEGEVIHYKVIRHRAEPKVH